MSWTGDNARFVCYGCTNRAPHCHSTCKQYQQELEDWENKKQWLKQQPEYVLRRDTFGKNITRNIYAYI